MLPQQYIRIGKILKTQGINGDIIVAGDFSNIDIPENIEFVFIEIESQKIPFAVEDFFIHSPKTAIVKLQLVNNAHEAREFTDCQLFIEGNAASVSQRDAVDYSHYKGFQITDKKHGKLGIVSEVLHFPQNSVFRIFIRGQEVLIPITDAIIEKEDTTNKVIHINTPEGLLDIYLGKDMG